jgi:hypothetical protein
MVIPVNHAKSATEAMQRQASKEWRVLIGVRVAAQNLPSHQTAVTWPDLRGSDIRSSGSVGEPQICMFAVSASREPIGLLGPDSG